MAESEGPGARGAAMPGERPAPAPQPPQMDVAAALGSLDRASHDFSRRLGRPPAASDPASAGAGPALDARMEAAEREAREYLEQAKRRADSLVTAMVGAVERQASEIRREAEEGIRARWREVERDANRYIDDSRRIGNEIATERRNEIAKLSDGITRRAEALTMGMEDADRVRRQFDAFIRALSITAGQIAADAAPSPAPAPAQSGELRDLRRLFRPSSVAA
jgi:hypothetical protein